MRGWRFFELLTEESCVNFCEKAASLLWKQRNKGFLTNCVLVRGGLAARHKSAPKSPHHAAHPKTTTLCSMSVSARYEESGVPAILMMNFIPMAGDVRDFPLAARCAI